MKKHLKIFACYFRLNLASALEYRASFFTQAFGMALSNSAFIFFWWIAFGQVGTRIAGYSFEDVMFIWAAASSAYGLHDIVFSNTKRLSELIVTGELDTFVLQPCNILLNVLCARTSLAAWGDFIYGHIIMIIIYAGNAVAWGWFFISVIIGAFVFTAISLLAHSLSFYLGDATMIGQMAAEFAISFSVYPEKIYAPAMRAVMFSVIPVGLSVHIPLRLLGSFSPWLLLAAIGGSAAYCALAAGFFYLGLRRYESGNVIVTRQ
jgi:ABC-2 type transport system permease protein